MKTHTQLGAEELQSKIRHKKIKFAGNLKLKIYGTLHCASGKRMKKENRVFFKSQIEATERGYRPCAHCLKAAYNRWRASKKQVD
jgi:methylphosphotriester-DNA--protein-cysteine methyltransferase